MAYYYKGNILNKNVTIDGVTYPSTEFSALEGVLPIKEVPTINPETQVIEFTQGAEVNGEWVNFEVRSKTDEELMAFVRQKRDTLLRETDWTGMSDVTMSVEMASYRQALRDLPATVDLNNPIYPTKP